ncbi:MAG: PAS domain-containing sensor histidine kinase [Deltaproteobacteria bacterium]|nr:MAG: PAS domain-containing sensor histidine kinase [Deltaproteobacteria bacterium]
MTDYQEAQIRDQRRRRRERYLIILLFLMISFLTYLGTKVFDLGLDLPFSSSILIFALININVILLLLLLFLTVRNLVKLLFERKKNIMGVRLRTKLVLAFMILSLLPTIILFFVSVQFIATSIEYWFDLQIEKSLKNSLEVGQDYYNRIGEEMLSLGNNLSRVITYEGYMLVSRKDLLEKFLMEKRREYRLSTVCVYSKKLVERAVQKDHRVDLSSFKGPGVDVLKKSFGMGTDSQFVESSAHGDLVYGIVPVFSRTETKAVVGLVAASRFIPGAFVNRLRAISRGLQEYRQLKMLKKPMKISHLIMLSIVTLLIIFSSVWFGFYVSQGITVPIRELAEGTNRIASGDYDFFIDMESKDEIGVLVNSFNRMTTDLRTSKNQLEAANLELRKSNIELEQRRLYMEIVLANVAAGVISADSRGKILTMNKSAEDMLDIQAGEIIGKNYRDVLSPDYVETVDGFLRDKNLFQKGSLKKQVRIHLKQKVLTVLISLNVLRDDGGNYLGLVAVLEDLSEIEKAQRMAAWREVARRIAHEVKNPLTPIQLSAQRLKKRYGEVLGQDDGKVFNDCTEMIIRQVDELKRLVNEFSSFARMPAANFALEDISKIIREALDLYKEAHRDVTIRLHDSKDVPQFNLDREQIKRVMINLLDNAIAAMDGKGEVVIDLSYNAGLQMVKIEVADSGKGIPPENKMRLFEPYFSTKKQGTGLGLAIVNTIITDHNGFIRVHDNEPKGTKFIIELPVRV